MRARYLRVAEPLDFGLAIEVRPCVMELYSSIPDRQLDFWFDTHPLSPPTLWNNQTLWDLIELIIANVLKYSLIMEVVTINW